MFIFNYGSVWFLILFEISIDLRTLEYTSSSSWVISQKSILNFVGYFWMHKTITESGLFDDNKVLSEQLACCLIEWNFRENYCLGCMWTERYLHFFPFIGGDSDFLWGSFYASIGWTIAQIAISECYDIYYDPIKLNAEVM